MRVVLAHTPNRDILDIRRALLGVGLECAVDDCVPRKELPLRLAQGNVDLVVIEASTNGIAPRIIQEARFLTDAPIFAAGPKSADIERLTREAGVSVYLNTENYRTELDRAMQNVTGTESGDSDRRGKVISVFAPTAGTGGTTIAANLAGAFAKVVPKKERESIALIELVRDFGDLALLADVKPEESVSDLCQRWETLDAAMMQDCALKHDSGVQLLVNSDDQSGNEALDLNSVRRVAVLARVAFPLSVIALDDTYTEVEIEAMRLSDLIVFVVRPDVPSVRRAKWAMGLLNDNGISQDRIQLVVNRWGQGGQLSKSHIEETVGMKIAHSIPDDPPRVNRSANRGVFLHSLAGKSAICKKLTTLAKSLYSQLSSTK
jgi:pilus assembly protein CpaE